MTRARCLTAARRLPSLAVLLVVVAGCTRGFFRERADRDVEALLTEKSIDPRWDVRTRNWYVYPDPRARFADGDKPDHPKKPPDDPAAAALSPDPQPLRSRFCSGPDQEGTGYLEFLRYCDQHNRNRQPRPADERPAATLGNPAQAGSYENPVPAASTGQSFDRALASGERGFLITLEQAVELAQFNSRELQERREDLYGTALAVTLQRFQFVPQLFAGIQATRTWIGREVPGGPGSAWDITSTGSVSQLFPTGAQVVARLANQLAIDLTTGSPNVGLSNLTLQVAQPLLRGGGWAVTLEPLTQAERNLVYGVRSYARFRTNYFVYLAGGEDVNNAAYGYDGLGAGLFIPGTGLQAPAQGYLPTLVTVMLARNEEANVAAFTRYFELYRQYQRRGDFSELQVGQVEQQILNARTRLLNQRQTLQNSLDLFKLQLGVPTQLPLELDDAPVRPMTDKLAEMTRAREEYNALRVEADTFFIPTLLMAGAVPAVLPVRLPVRDKIESMVLYSPVTRATENFKATIAGRWAVVRGRSSEQLLAAISPPKGVEDWEPPADAELMRLELAIRAYEAAFARPNLTAADLGDLYDEVVSAFIRVMNEARVERRRLIRETWPKAPAVTVDGTDMLAADLDAAQTVAAQAALTNRVELMNARAQVVDAWRRIAVQANSLLGVANVGYNFSTPSTPNANEPFALGGSRSTHQLVLSGELPLVRRAERNNYRAALIAYQRARRSLQATEDFILADVRGDLRALRVFAESYRIQQRAVEVAYDQVENSLDVLQSPPEGGAVRPGQGAAGAGNAAALTQQLLQAQNSLLQAQNGIYNVWVNYLIARMRFYRDIERLPLDPRGVWIDESCPPPPDVETLPDPGAVGAAEPERFAELPAPGDR